MVNSDNDSRQDVVDKEGVLPDRKLDVRKTSLLLRTNNPYKSTVEN